MVTFGQFKEKFNSLYLFIEKMIKPCVPVISVIFISLEILTATVSCVCAFLSKSKLHKIINRSPRENGI